MRKPILVFDLGTSALKAVLFAADGSILASSECGFPAVASAHRQAPRSWWDAAIAATRALSGPEPAAIALTGTMENLIPVAANGLAVGDALLYSDPCGAEILQEGGADDFATIVGNQPEPLMTAFKLRWLAAHEPLRFAAARWFLPGSKDYLALCLTGRAVTDPSCAATTGLFELGTDAWSETLLPRFGVSRERLPEILPATDIIGVLIPTAATALGLPAGLPVVNGCGDGAATTLGSGATTAADISIYLGSSGWVARVAAMPERLEPKPFYRLPHPLLDGVIEIAPVLSAGAAAAWARTALGLELAEAEALALEADKRSGETLFLPYLTGERFPFTDLGVKGAFLGLAASDPPGALYLAVLQGVAFAIAANLEAMGGVAGGRLSLVGGGALSRIWPQLIADTFGAAVTIPADPLAATSLGAFRLACRALGWPDRSAQQSRRVEPRPEHRARVDRQGRQFAAATAFARTLSQL